MSIHLFKDIFPLNDFMNCCRVGGFIAGQTLFFTTFTDTDGGAPGIRKADTLAQQGTVNTGRYKPPTGLAMLKTRGAPAAAVTRGINPLTGCAGETPPER